MARCLGALLTRCRRRCGSRRLLPGPQCFEQRAADQARQPLKSNLSGIAGLSACEDSRGFPTPRKGVSACTCPIGQSSHCPSLTDWPTTPIRADARGRYTFEFKAPAPHATREWKFYVTRDGWQPGSPLRWADLQEFCTLGNVPVSGDVYKLDCPLPKRSGQHIIYNTWQRSDSGEAFYTCADVRFEGGGGVTPPPQWQDAGPVTARGALDVGTILTLRVFNAEGNDLESPQITLAAGQTAANQWPLALAHKVNGSAQQARVGVMKNGVITPVASATENRVYLKPGNLFQLDTRVPGPVDPIDPPPADDYDFVYPAGIGSYKPGQTVVKGTDGKLYACRPFPEGAWCNINAEAYRPGTGSAWRDAWIEY
ncbi:lytic polysaccharide monooxygenase [Stenotrophomonas maltophilia]|uniref:lytic polysaccharide monooxygenase n=1 Tax=Stenotrophomonas maltophilia TaxID=40324 RepID=UPI003D18B723